MRRTPLAAVGIIVLASAFTFAAGPQPSAELQKAVAAAERARSTPQGGDYQSAFNVAVRDMMFSALRDCIPIRAPGVRKPPSFQCVVVGGKAGKPKWIIRDSRDPMAVLLCEACQADLPSAGRR
jgi:hypothetical protein